MKQNCFINFNVPKIHWNALFKKQILRSLYTLVHRVCSGVPESDFLGIHPAQVILMQLPQDHPEPPFANEKEGILLEGTDRVFDIF